MGRPLHSDENKLLMMLEINRMIDSGYEELARASLELCVKLTNSDIGYFHLVKNDEQNISLYIWSKNVMKHCSAQNPGHYSLDKAGIWADCVRLRRPVVHNGYQKNKDKKGYPEGHFHVDNHMSVPVFDGGKIRAIVGVGNKSGDYDEWEEKELHIFASHIWQVLKRRSAEIEAQKAVEELKKMNEAKDQFIHIITHDLKEPLRTISGYLDILELKKAECLDTEAKELLSWAKKGAFDMIELIKGLLEYTRQSGRVLDRELVDCGEMIEFVKSRLAKAIEESGAVIKAGGLPGIVADKAMISVLFQNLTANAIKFKGASKPVIEISGKRYTGGECKFSVKDNGIGIEPQYQEKIFEIFERGGAGSRFQGTGMGLAICSKIVQMHGGKISVESEPGKGSTFTFTIREV